MLVRATFIVPEGGNLSFRSTYMKSYRAVRFDGVAVLRLIFDGTGVTEGNYGQSEISNFK